MAAADPPAPNDPHSEADYRLEVGAAAITALQELPPGDLLAAITPERLGAITGYSASSIRYRLAGGSGWRFDRAQLVEALVDALFAHLRRATEASLHAYAGAVAEAPLSEPFEELSAAIHADMNAFTPGGSPDEAAAAAETARLFSTVAAGNDRSVAQQMRTHYEAWVAMYLPVYDHVLAALGRRMRPGADTLDLAMHVSAYLGGTSDRRRFEPQLDRDAITLGVVALIYGWTEPIDGDEADLRSRFNADWRAPARGR